VTLAALPPVTAMLLYVGVGIAGLLVGAMVNAAADRVLGVDEPLWRAADCVKCGAPLSAARYLPLRNFARGRRTCASCGARASLRRPLLEVALALVFPLLLAHALDPGNAARLAPWAILLIDLAAVAVLAFVFAVDLEHRLILDSAVLPVAAGLMLVAGLFDHKAFAGMLFGVVVCGGSFLLLYGLGWLIYREEALGFGDVKLAALTGLLVGWPAAGTLLLLVALLGGSASVLRLGLGTATRRTFIPFGIFLAAGAVLTLLLAPPYW
jgi:leader peptidase (prepilin peptidase) / N-methyltransferase